MDEIKIPDTWPADAQAMMSFLLKRNALLEKKILELEQRLKQNSSNSNRPPSQDPPWKKRYRPRRPSGRKRGGQPGHRGRNRPLLPADQVKDFQAVKPETCSGCGLVFPENAPVISTRRHQQVELPVVEPFVTEFQVQTCGCPGCGHTTSGTLPAEVGGRTAGPRLQSLMAFLSGRMRLSRRQVGELLEVLLGSAGRFSLGCISECEEDLAKALEGPCGEALAWIRNSPSVHVDETGWKIVGDTAWLWVAATKAVSVFRIDRSRSATAYLAFLKDFEGILVSDRWTAYRKVPGRLRQLCWAHLKRDFQKLVDREAGAEKIGSWALRELKTIFDLWHIFLDGEITQMELHQEFVSIKARFARLLNRGTRSKDAKAQGFCQNLLNAWPSLWTFLKHGGQVEPTNNQAERDLRPGVIWRKTSFGVQSERGTRFTETILTTVTSLRKQGRNILDFLTQALVSFRTGSLPPSCLPIPAG